MEYEGKLVTSATRSDRGKVYLVRDGRRVWIRSPMAFQELGYRGEDILRIDDVVLDGIARSDDTIPAGDANMRKSVAKQDLRYDLGRKYLRGDGIEVGALHNPLPVHRGVTVRYVDILTTEQNIARYPEIAPDKFVPVEIVDDGEILGKVPDGSVDFVIGNHFFEHLQNPLGTLRNHLSKLRVGGVIYYAIPNKDHTFDHDRPVTPFEHLVKDDTKGAEWSRKEHYREYVHFVDKQFGEAAQRHASLLMAVDNRIHFHVWDAPALRDLFARAQGYLGYTFMVEEMVENDHEVIVILRKVP